MMTIGALRLEYGIRPRDFDALAGSTIESISYSSAKEQLAERVDVPNRAQHAVAKHKRSKRSERRCSKPNGRAKVSWESGERER